jgi:hypothetical protein
MKKKEENENSFFGGFEAVVDGLARIERVTPGSRKDPDDNGFETVTEIGNQADEIPMTDPSEITGHEEPEEIETVEEIDNGLQKEKRQKKEVVEVEDEDEDDEVEEIPAIETGVSDLGEYEKDVVDFFTDRFTSELGWEVNDETKPKTVGEVVEYLKGIVAESSQPQYASEEIAKLNEYVAAGGNLKTFYQEAFNNSDLDLLDLNNESVQKKILKDNFSRLGYTPEKVERFISRYEDSGTLQEEAEDALELLKEYQVSKSEELLANQEKSKQEQVKQQQKFYKDVYTNIEKTDSIRGIPISAKEKKELNEYIFKPEADGLTKYQKDYAKDYRNLIESAYFTMKGDSLIQKVTQKATSQAAKNLQDKLANKGKRVKNSSTTHGSSSSTLGAWDTVSRQLRRPNF